MNDKPSPGMSPAREELVGFLAETATGDESAFAELYDRTSAKLFGICLRICGDRSTAEDILQDVYVRIWNVADQYGAGRSSPITWLSVIARNIAIDHCRKTGTQRTSETRTDTDNLVSAIDEKPLADAELELQERYDRLAACIEQLVDDQRQPILSSFFGGFTYADLADRINVPLSTMKSRIRRGLMALKECLGDG